MNCCKIAHHEMYILYEDGRVYSEKLGIFLKPRLNPNGYLIVNLDRQQLSLHRLVCKHFVPNPYDYEQVNHKDGNKQNNHFSNLEWCTAQQNIEHALKTNLRKGFIPVSVKKELLSKVLAGATVLELSRDFPKTHPNTLNKMLREQAIKDGLLEQWTNEAKRKRKLVAKANLEKANAKNKENR